MNAVIFYDMVKYISIRTCIEKMCCLNTIFQSCVWKELKTRHRPVHILKYKHYGPKYISIKNMILLRKMSCDEIFITCLGKLSNCVYDSKYCRMGWCVFDNCINILSIRQRYVL